MVYECKSSSLSRQISNSTVASEADVGWSSLVVAVQRGSASAIAEMLKDGFSPNLKEASSGWTLLMFAASAGKAASVKVLLEYGADVNLVARPHDWTALTVAILSGSEEVIGLLLDAGADVSMLRRRHPHFSDMYRAAQEQHLAHREAFPLKASPIWVYDYCMYV